MIRQAIIAELDRRGISRYQFAKELGWSTQEVYRVLADGANMTTRTAERMMEALGLKVKGEGDG